MFQDLNPEKARDPFFVYILNHKPTATPNRNKIKNIQGLYTVYNRIIHRFYYIQGSNIMVLIRII